MFFEDFFGEPLTLSMEVIVGNQSQGIQTITAPEPVCMQQFNQVVNEVGHQSAPVKVIFSQDIYLEDGITKRTNQIIFENNAYYNAFHSKEEENV